MHVTVKFFGDANNIQELAEQMALEIPNLKLKRVFYATRLAFFEAETDVAVQLLKKNKFLEWVKAT